MPAQHIAFGFQAGQRLFDIGYRFAQWRSDLRQGLWAMAAQAGAQQFAQCVVGLDGLVEASEPFERWLPVRCGVQCQQQVQAFAGQPELVIGQAQGTPGLGQLP